MYQARSSSALADKKKNGWGKFGWEQKVCKKWNGTGAIGQVKMEKVTHFLQNVHSIAISAVVVIAVGLH